MMTQKRGTEMPMEWNDNIADGGVQTGADASDTDKRADNAETVQDTVSAGTEADMQEEIILMKELITKGRKQLFYTRILAFALCGLLAAVVIALCIVVPPAVRTINNVDTAVVGATNTLSKADEALDNINTMSVEVTLASKQMNEFIETNSESVTQSMQKLQNVDFEGLNNAISDLEAVVEPMAKLFGKK